MSAAPSFRLAVATSAAFADLHPDDACCVPALRARDIEPVACVWNDPTVAWAAFDAVLIRSIWDYFKHYADFLRWLDRLPVATINPLPTLHWNADKRYLLELAERGVDIIPTSLVDGDEVAYVTAAVYGRPVVVKPRVSGGGWHTVRGVPGDPVFEHALAQLPREFDYLVQPFVPEIVSAGEWSLLFFGGAYSHAVLKRPAAGDYRVQSDFGGSATLTAAPPALIDSARRVLAAAAELGHGDIDYARVDGVVVDGRLRLMELELIEPLLHLRAHPSAPQRFAAAVRQRLQCLR